ncbi:hypothetical protein [Pseudomonas extremaustralis]|uniref:hypothetical protein n=1 Tax=Pseudomonas extremaustralis TaxID=359110 RepID=UPI002AA89367|nr:hypothetical protein [Pseudomonas extremaustralis]
MLRWLLGLFPAMPLGTLFANLVGGSIIDGAMALFIRWPNLYQRNASRIAPSWDYDAQRAHTAVLQHALRF